MRTYRVVTSQHEPYYNQIGKDCITSFLEYWPDNISIELWAEGFTPDIDDPRLIVKDFEKVRNDLDNFLELIYPHVPHDPNGKDLFSRYKFSWMKGHVITAALQECEQDVFIWLDSDVITNKQIPLQFFENLLPEDTLSVDIPAGGKVKGKEAETGFFMLNMNDPNITFVKDYFKKCHNTLEILQVSRRLDTGVWWNATHGAEKLGSKLKHLATAVDSIIPFMHTELKQYLRHWVTKSNKSNYEKGNTVTIEETL